MKKMTEMNATNFYYPSDYSVSPDLVKFDYSKFPSPVYYKSSPEWHSDLPTVLQQSEEIYEFDLPSIQPAIRRRMVWSLKVSIFFRDEISLTSDLIKIPYQGETFFFYLEAIPRYHESNEPKQIDLVVKRKKEIPPQPPCNVELNVGLANRLGPSEVDNRWIKNRRIGRTVLPIVYEFQDIADDPEANSIVFRRFVTYSKLNASQSFYDPKTDKLYIEAEIAVV